MTEKYACDDMVFFSNVKDSLRYESDLADRRLTYLLTIQVAFAGGYAYFADRWQAVAVTMVAFAVSLILFQILRKGEIATRRLKERWNEYCGDRGLTGREFPPLWGISGLNTQRSWMGRAFKRIVGVEAEYYVVLACVIAMCWILMGIVTAIGFLI